MVGKQCMLLVFNEPRRWNCTPAVVQVTEIYDNTGDVVRLTGVKFETYNQFNSLYRITEIGVGAARVSSASDVSISGVTTAGIGTSPLDNAAVYVTGESLRITNLSYETNSGIATLTSANNHGLRVNSKLESTQVLQHLMVIHLRVVLLLQESKCNTICCQNWCCCNYLLQQVACCCRCWFINVCIP